jgi:hypothetical protein
MSYFYGGIPYKKLNGEQYVLALRSQASLQFKLLPPFADGENLKWLDFPETRMIQYRDQACVDDFMGTSPSEYQCNNYAIIRLPGASDFPGISGDGIYPAPHAGKIIIVGGDYSTGINCLIFDPETETYSDGPSLINPQPAPCLCWTADGIVAVGLTGALEILKIIDGALVWQPLLVAFLPMNPDVVDAQVLRTSAGVAKYVIYSSTPDGSMNFFLWDGATSGIPIQYFDTRMIDWFKVFAFPNGKNIIVLKETQEAGMVTFILDLNIETGETTYLFRSLDDPFPSPVDSLDTPFITAACKIDNDYLHLVVTDRFGYNGTSVLFDVRNNSFVANPSDYPLGSPLVAGRVDMLVRTKNSADDPTFAVFTNMNDGTVSLGRFDIGQKHRN